MTSIATKFLIIGGVLLLLSLPLMFRMVPMNRVYGFRIKAAYESEKNWYDINARGGKLLSIGALVILLIGAAGYFVPEKYTLIYIGVAAIVTFAAIVISLLCVAAWQKQAGP